ncbi:MAG: YraN family protein [Acidimicrobiales bacterium]
MADGDIGAREERGLSQGRRRLGQVGERLAALHYAQAGFEVVDTNWRCRQGELDLVARKGSLVVFVEVKNRSSTAYGHPLEAVTAQKQQRLRRLAALWFQEHRRSGEQAHLEARFDVVAVLDGRLEVVTNAF